MAWLLALDGATEQLALALVRADGSGLSRELPGGAQASATLLPALLDLLAEAGVSASQLDALAFGQGPGAFTGLRSVCAVTQGLALGWGLPVLAIDSLLIPAEAAWTAGAPPDWGVAMDARMGELYAARYRRTAAGWQTLEAAALWSAEALKAHWSLDQRPATLAGNGLALIGAAPDQAGPRAAALGRLAAMAAAGALPESAPRDAALALPVYVRDKVAQTTAEREAAAPRVAP